VCSNKVENKDKTGAEQHGLSGNLKVVVVKTVERENIQEKRKKC
jgi:hypothetical protein